MKSGKKIGETDDGFFTGKDAARDCTRETAVPHRRQKQAVDGNTCVHRGHGYIIAIKTPTESHDIIGKYKRAYRLWIGTKPENLKPLEHAVGDGKWGTLHSNYLLAAAHGKSPIEDSVLKGLKISNTCLPPRRQSSLLM